MEKDKDGDKDGEQEVVAAVTGSRASLCKDSSCEQRRFFHLVERGMLHCLLQFAILLQILRTSPAFKASSVTGSGWFSSN